MCPPYGQVLCHEASHLHLDECACPEFYTGGAKLQPLPGPHGKLTPRIVQRHLAQLPPRSPHLAPPSVLSLTQATECGTLYSAKEIGALAAAARAAGMKVHMDGARFANAIAASGAAPADMSWRAGVDVMTFGATKNGCVAAEAVIFFDSSLAREFEHRRKRGGHLWSKMRFLAAQFDAYVTDGLWLSLASHANAMAQRLADGLGAIDGVDISHPVQINEVFASLPPDLADRLRARGALFHPWMNPGDTAGGRMARFVCSFATTPEEVDRLVDIARDSIG